MSAPTDTTDFAVRYVYSARPSKSKIVKLTASPRGIERDVLGTAHYQETVIPAGFQDGKGTAHRHPGPEAWFVIAGGQCLETPKGVMTAQAGQAMLARKAGRWRSPASAPIPGGRWCWCSTEPGSPMSCLSTPNQTRHTLTGNHRASVPDSALAASHALFRVGNHPSQYDDRFIIERLDAIAKVAQRRRQLSAELFD